MALRKLDILTISATNYLINILVLMRNLDNYLGR